MNFKINWRHVKYKILSSITHESFFKVQKVLVTKLKVWGPNGHKKVPKLAI